MIADVGGGVSKRVAGTCLTLSSRESGIQDLPLIPYAAGPVRADRPSSALAPLPPVRPQLPYPGVHLRRARNSSTTPPIAAMPP